MRNVPTHPDASERHALQDYAPGGSGQPFRADPESDNRPLSRKRPRRYVETEDFAPFARRIIRALGRRVAEGDVESLPKLVALSEELDAAIVEAVTGLRAAGYSWAEIATRIGITRQTAHERWASRSAAS